ncbi:MAG TPA: sulfite exporter TauE/SafE family protein [Casimicrobiaceae bacterium]|nr:sulfite exporter TauE/SafE family protein [Casimicrobiaceae bacterium]
MISVEHWSFRTALRFAATFALALLACAPIFAHADTVASLLGNFTVNQYSGLELRADGLDVRHVVVFGQLPALRELHLADADGDGVTTQSERDAYAGRLAETLAADLTVAVDGVRVPLRARRWTTSLPTEEAGFSLRVEIDFAGDLPAATTRASHALTFANDSYAGRFGWREIVVKPARSIAIFDTDAVSTSLTEGLTQNVQAMPVSGPLAEREIHLMFTSGAMPQGAHALGPRPGTIEPVAQPAVNAYAGATSSWIARETRRIVDFVSARDVPLHVSLLALLAAALLGALHAFSPGHGKTVAGAYLVGSRSTAGHAVFLGLTVTITHTLGVFALGFATLVASSYIVPERVLPVLSFVSGFLVLAIGVALLAQRWRSAVTADAGPRYRKVASTQWRAVASHGTHSLAFAHGHAHGHSHGALVHSHGGSVHSHLPPRASGEKVTWRSLVTLGVSGGLVPCPSAMVLLLAAIALNKTAYGLLLVLAFSLGLAFTLTAVGFVFLYARNRIGALRAGTRWQRWVPVASAGVITVVGVAMCYGAFVATSL